MDPQFHSQLSCASLNYDSSAVVEVAIPVYQTIFGWVIAKKYDQIMPTLLSGFSIASLNLPPATKFKALVVPSMYAAKSVISAMLAP